MSAIYLIRHADVTPMDDRHASLWPLTDRGRQQAQAVADLPFWPEVRAIYSSPEAKARETVAPAARRYGLEIRICGDLRELDRPLGLIPDYHAAVAACFDQPEAAVNGWEPAAQVQRRMRNAIRQLAAEAEGPIALVSHGLAFSMLLAGLAGKAAPTLAEWRAIPMPGWAVLDRQTGRLVTPFTAL